MSTRLRLESRLKSIGSFSAVTAAALLTFAQGLSADPAAPSATPGAFDPGYILSGAIAPPPGDKITSFDISWVDPVLQRYYIASRTSKAAIAVNTLNNQIAGNFKPGFAGFSGNNDTSGPDGIMTVDHKEIWVGDFPSRVFVLDATTGAQIVPPISTGGMNRADEMCYDPVDKILAVVNNADSPPFITFISTASKTVLGSVVFDGAGGRPRATNGAEQCQWNPRNGLIYLSIPEVGGPGDNSAPGAVVVFNPTTRAIVNTMSVPLSACTGPQGLAIGPPPQIGLGCNVGVVGGSPAANTAIINENTGAVIAAFPGKGGGDEIWYNPGNLKYFFAARQAPGGEALFIIDAGTFAVQRLSTGTLSNAHSVAVDPVSNTAYVPTSSAATSGLCSSMGAVDANGCILLYTPSVPTPEPGCFTGALLGDLNGDARADVLWRRDDGAVSAWLMNGTSVTSAVAMGAVPTNFFVAGVGDLNGDGTADVVWRRPSDGAVSIWLVNGGAVTSATAVGTVPPEWHIVGVRDFDGDGKADILWRRATDGAISLWFMNGATVASATAVGTVGLEWDIFGVGDFNGDRKADILWRRGDGAVSVWLMNGASVASAAAIASITMDWHIFGVADFNADGQADVLWRRDDGAVSMWLMSGASVTSATAVASVGSDFTIAGIGDLNANNTADILWRSNSGNITFWLMNGPSITSVVGSGILSSVWRSCHHEPIGPVGVGAQAPWW